MSGVGRSATALGGAVAGAVVGLVLLVTTEPTSAYTNDSYRQGASVGFVIRYAVLGLVAAFLVRYVWRSRPVLAGIALALVLTAAILPPALDEQTASEKRRSEAVAEKDPVKREAAEFRGGMIEGCVNRTRDELEGTPEEDGFDADGYCVCLIDGAIARPGRTYEEMKAILTDLQASGPSPEYQQAMARCYEEAQGG